MKTSAPKPAYRQVSDNLRARVLAHNLSPGAKFLTVREVAREYNVSLVTAQKSVRQLVDESILVTRRPHGSYVAEGIRSLARLSERPLVNLIGGEYIPLPDAYLPADFLRGIRETFPLAHLRLDYVSEVDTTVEFLKDLIELDANKKTARAYVLRSVAPAVQRFFAEHKLPAIATGLVPPDVDLPNVSRDEKQIVYSVTRHLLNKGHRRIVFLERMTAAEGALHRRAGFAEALLEMNIISNYEEVDRYLTRLSFSRAEAISKVRELLNSEYRPSALIVGHDLLAAWILRSVLDEGVRVPEDLAMVSLQDGAILEEIRPRLSVVPRCEYEIGVWVGRLVAKLLREEPITERHHLIPVSLIQRDTS